MQKWAHPSRQRADALQEFGTMPIVVFAHPKVAQDIGYFLKFLLVVRIVAGEHLFGFAKSVFGASNYFTDPDHADGQAHFCHYFLDVLLLPGGSIDAVNRWRRVQDRKNRLPIRSLFRLLKVGFLLGDDPLNTTSFIKRQDRIDITNPHPEKTLNVCFFDSLTDKSIG